MQLPQVRDSTKKKAFGSFLMLGSIAVTALLVVKNGYSRRGDVLMQDLELTTAYTAIDVDFSVEATDDAIRVVEGQA